MKPNYDDLIAKCPNRTQDTSVIHEIDGCSSSPDNLESWDNLPYTINYNLYVTNPIWGTVIGNTNNINQPLACNAHDICYQTCGSDKSTCDIALGVGITASCDTGYPFPCALNDQSQCVEYNEEYNSCREIGPIYANGVGLAGQSAFEERYTGYCQCCQ